MKENMKVLHRSDNFTSWLYEQLKPHIRGEILETGSYLGTYSQKIIRDFPDNKITLSDSDEKIVADLKKSYHGKNIRVIELILGRRLNISDAFDTIICSNVLEHVNDDSEGLQNMYDLLKPGGNLLLLVPMHKRLFNPLDDAGGHYRRYTKKEITGKVIRTGFKIKETFWFNSAAILGWYLKGNFLGERFFSSHVMGIFDKVVPMLRFIEKRILRRRIGISLVMVIER